MNGVFVLLLTCVSSWVHGQTAGYLILMDAENSQAFTIRMGDQLFASSGHGHLVIPSLKDSSYLLNIRFTKKNIPELLFPVTVHHRDLGFQLRRSDSSWVLFNWQSGETIHPKKEVDSNRLLDHGIKREDGFSKLMAAVVNDSSVMYNTYSGPGFNRDTSIVKTEIPKPVPLTPDLKDSLVKIKGANPVIVSGGLVKTQKPVRDSLEKQKPIKTADAGAGVKKLREVSLKISRKIVFQDNMKNGQRDTITLFIYFEKKDTANKNQKKEVNEQTAVVTNPASTISEPACAHLASESDLEYVRNGILKANSDQDKIEIASKAFASSCFSVGQIRVLAGLFVSDKMKYQLMEAARLHISDYNQFRGLADMYTDKVIQKKFLQLTE